MHGARSDAAPTIRSMSRESVTHPVQLGFLPPEQAISDPEHPGLLRAGPRATGPYGGEGVEVHECPATDMTLEGVDAVGLLDAGFDTADLTPLTDLQSVLARIREVGCITEDDAATIRSELDGAVLRCASGATLTVLHLADEGLFMRSAGPNRMPAVPAESDGMNDHGPAASVHADQDVYGTPMRQLMEGRAPSMFRHDSPDGHHHDTSLMLVNLWIPLQQIVQPLVLADGRSIDRRRHQLRYGLPTDSFLDRDDDAAINDIWRFLHDDEQRWYFRSEMDHRSAYVFNTMSTPHGAGVLPGEELAEHCARALAAGERAATIGDAEELLDALSPLAGATAPATTTPALRTAIDEMLVVVDQAIGDPAGSCGVRAQEWVARSAAARRRVVRMSLEMRLVASVETG